MNGKVGSSKEFQATSSEDETLVVRWREGNHDAFTELVDRHKGNVYWLVRRMVGSEQAEDFTQETFLRAYQALPRFRGDCSFRTWLARIARNLCLTEMEKRGRFKKQFSFEEDAEEAVCRIPPHSIPNLERQIERQELSRVVHACLDRLPERFRTMLTLFYLNEIRYEEIAEIMEMPLGTVKAYIHRARLRLRDLVVAETGVGERRQK